MRIQLSYANASLVRALIAANAVADIGANGLDMIELELHGGERVIVHLIERDIDLDLIGTMLAEDAHSQHASMFILWSDMLLPEDGDRYQPYDWMLALLALYGDKIYGFDVYAQSVSFYPVYFEPQPPNASGTAYAIHYGDPIDVNRIGAETIHARSHVPGTWRIVDFEEGRRGRGAVPGAGPSRTVEDEDTRFDRLHADRNPVWVYYALLGVDIHDNTETVRRAYRTLAIKYHPDRNPSPEATQRMQLLNLAYEEIMKLRGED